LSTVVRIFYNFKYRSMGAQGQTWIGPGVASVTPAQTKYFIFLFLVHKSNPKHKYIVNFFPSLFTYETWIPTWTSDAYKQILLIIWQNHIIRCNYMCQCRTRLIWRVFVLNSFSFQQTLFIIIKFILFIYLTKKKMCLTHIVSPDPPLRVVHLELNFW